MGKLRTGQKDSASVLTMPANTKPQWVLSLEQVNRSDAARVGNKAAALGALLQAGYPVPPGLCVTTSAFSHAIGPRHKQIQTILAGHDLRIPAEADAGAALIAGLLDDLRLPGPLVEALDEAIDQYPATFSQPLAVRSSATAEDRAGASFAGLYLSRIGVAGIAALHEAILECWRSFFNAPALANRAHHGLLPENEAMGVLIQPALNAECSGVCYTVDPIRLASRRFASRRFASRRIVIAACWGLGTGVVDGNAAADTAWLQRKDLEIDDVRIAEKIEEYRLDPAGGIQRLSVPLERVQTACLPDAWQKRVAAFGLAAELFFGMPQDLEWAVAEQRIWLLQSRPLSGLPPETDNPLFSVVWQDPQDQRQSWRLVPLCDGTPMLPAEWDYTDAGANAKADSAIFSGEEQSIQVKFFNGRPYFSLFPSGLSADERQKRRAAIEDLQERLYHQDQTAWDYWGPEVIPAVERSASFDLQHCPGPDLAKHLENTLGAVRRHWMIHAQLWPVFLPRLQAAFAEITGLTGPQLNDETGMLLQGEETPLTHLIDRLYGMAEIARSSPALLRFLAAPPPDPLIALEKMAAERSDPEVDRVQVFLTEFDRFLKTFGDRTGKGFGSETTVLMPSWREKPEWALQLVALYLDPSLEPPARTRERAREGRDARVEALLQSCPNLEQVREFRRLLALARHEAAILEEHNYYIDQMSGSHLRAALLAAGQRLAESRWIQAVEDVFWLRVAEITASLRGEFQGSLVQQITGRKRQHEAWSKLETPPVLGLPDAYLGERPEQPPQATTPNPDLIPANDNRITGQAASAGKRRGRARVLSAGVIVPDLQPGDVLVAENAGPLWTPFFPILGGLVLDKGNITQHAAATAREYGLPAVIGAGDATRRIPDGAWVLVDGDRGIVEIENGYQNRDVL